MNAISGVFSRQGLQPGKCAVLNIKGNNEEAWISIFGPFRIQVYRQSQAAYLSSHITPILGAQLAVLIAGSSKCSCMFKIDQRGVEFVQCCKRFDS